MLKANMESVKINSPKAVKSFSSTCACGICSGGSGNCKGCQDKNVNLNKIKEIYSR